MQQKIQADSVGEVIKKIVEDAKQTTTQCMAEVAIIQVKLDSIRANISAPIK